MIAILYTQADVDQYKSESFKASADRMGNGLLAKHDTSGPPKEPAVYSAHSGKLMDFSLNRECSVAFQHDNTCGTAQGICISDKVPCNAQEHCEV